MASAAPAAPIASRTNASRVPRSVAEDIIAILEAADQLFVGYVMVRKKKKKWKSKRRTFPCWLLRVHRHRRVTLRTAKRLRIQRMISPVFSQVDIMMMKVAMVITAKKIRSSSFPTAATGTTLLTASTLR